MATPDHLWTKMSRKYAAQPIKDQAAYQETLLRTTEHLGPDDHVLELGCGTGSTAFLIAPAVKTYLATDFSSGMIGIAEEKMAAARQAGDAPEGLRFAVAEGFDEAVEADPDLGGYDAVLGFNFLHLIEDPAALLTRVRTLIKPGGLLITKTVCLRKRAWLFAPLIAVMRFAGKAPYVNMLSFDGLETLIQDQGFELIETGTIPEPYSRFVVARKV
ncbi:class I SAM-dependent methyltransferase [Roseibium denhamense]|uniref:Methyltransferase domain-containing protein n=1 Tax=Roseibium denhamense TaxID=76305 RepID=A0ABY1P5E5_9HYPH|nr:class I SAM-dependent methyltransferase [Roseibium denhamense]MTI07140.1 class I SAM-dependent methyltransferase [Roseibium denhamense]SMP26865.1 Methyltransferase domain-containing protein [Roseibium denhamense]